MSNIPTFNIITLGNSGVGKSSIIKRYINDLFDENSLPTVGLDFSIKDIVLKNKKKVKLKLIDTGGQEKYRSIAKSYYKNADGVLFVYTINNQKSFDQITEWIESFNDNYDGKGIIPQIIVESKNDLERVVDKEISIKLAKEKGLDLISTSAKTNDKIEELFIKLAEEINEKGKTRNGKQKSLKLKKDDSNKKKTICCIFKKEDFMDV